MNEVGLRQFLEVSVSKRCRRRVVLDSVPHSFSRLRDSDPQDPKRQPFANHQDSMITKFKVFVTPRLIPGYTAEEAKLAPGALNSVRELEVEAALETEAEDRAFDEVMKEIFTPESDPEAFDLSCQAVRLYPLHPVDEDMFGPYRREFALVTVRSIKQHVRCSDPRGQGFSLSPI